MAITEATGAAITGTSATSVSAAGEAGVQSAAAPAKTGAPAPDEAAQAWRLQIPDDLRIEKFVSEAKDLPTLVKRAVDAHKSFGSRLPFPTDADSEQDRTEKMKAIWARLGRPDSADNYGIGEPNLPEDVPWNMDQQREFLGHAHSLGLTKDQAAGVLEWYGDLVSEAALTHRQESAKVQETLREEWGRTYDRNLAYAHRAVDAIGGPKLKEFFNSTGLGNSTELIRAFAKMGRLLAEAQMISGRVEGILSPEEAQKKIGAIQANPEHPYHMKFQGQPAHDEAVKEMKMLFELAYPSTI